VKGIRVFCVRCGQTSTHPADVEEALEYHGRELALDTDGWHEVWDMCRECCEYCEEWRARVKRGGPPPF
jgi:hypothetical protein